MRTKAAWMGWIACGLCVSSFGCASAPDAADDGASEVATEPTVAEDSLLARVELTETHFIEFRELLPGELTVQEQLHVDRDSGPVANDFDPSKQSVTAFYRQLAGRSAKPQEVAALQQFEARALPFATLAANAAEPTSVPETTRAFNKATEPPGWDFLGEFSWFSSNFCRLDSASDRCFINLERFNEVLVAQGVRGALFNQDFSLRAQMRINFDPCFHKPSFPPTFCSEGFKGLQKVDLAPRTALNSNTWSGRSRYQVFAEGRHIGVFVDWR
jgi:hypothetical protein